ncbi:MAG: flagellin FljL [Alphaproteobacteria bacterium]
MNSINTNIGAMVALQNISKVNSDLDQVQNRVSTGLRVASATDDGAAFAVAQGLRGDIKAYESVNQQLSVAKGTVGVALEASTSISDTLNDLQSVLTKLSDENVTGDARTQYNADYVAIQTELVNFYSNADYNGVNLLETASTDVDVISNIDGSTYTVTAQDLQTSIAALAGAPADAAAAATALGGALGTAQTAANNALNSLAADSKRLDNQISFNSAVSDATEAGLGAIVDADLAKESARLTAIQTKQQLAIQTLSIANQAPSALVGLFR